MGTGIDESRGNPHHTWANERSPGDGVDRRTWEPGAGGWRPGGSASAWMTQGLRPYLRIAVARRRQQERKRREAHTYVQDAARLKRTRRKSRPSACSQCGSTCHWKGPGAIRIRLTPPERREIEFRAARVGTRCWSGGGREALVWPTTDQGSQAYLSLAAKIPWRESRKDRMSRPRQGVGCREAEWDGAGTGESRGKHHRTQANERSSSVTNGEQRSSGSPEHSDVAQGRWSALMIRGCSLP